MTSEFDFRMQQLRERYANSLGHKHAALSEAWRAFEAAPRDPALRRELSMQLHRLCGSAGAYGYDEIGASACTADRLVGEHGGIAQFDAAQLRDCASVVAEVLVALERARADTEPSPPP